MVEGCHSKSLFKYLIYIFLSLPVVVSGVGCAKLWPNNAAALKGIFNSSSDKSDKHHPRFYGIPEIPK